MMKESVSLLLVLLILLTGISCRTQPRSIEPQIEEVSSPVAEIDIKRRWEEQVKLLPPMTKWNAGQEIDILFELVEEISATQLSAELERVRKLPTEFERMEAYDRCLLETLFLIYAKLKDRDKLVYLLSAKCPRFISTSAIELEVASLQVKDPFLVLLDSYDNAQHPGARQYLLEIVRDSLKDLSQQNSDDAEFAKAARAWYVENQNRIETNPYYHPFAAFPELRDLFVPKP